MIGTGPFAELCHCLIAAHYTGRTPLRWTFTEGFFLDLLREADELSVRLGRANLSPPTVLGLPYSITRSKIAASIYLDVEPLEGGSERSDVGIPTSECWNGTRRDDQSG